MEGAIRPTLMRRVGIANAINMTWTKKKSKYNEIVGFSLDHILGDQFINKH